MMAQLEHDEQKSLFQWVKYMTGKYPELDSLYAIPNGGKRDIITAARLKAEGVRPGVPDMCLPVARHGYHGLYIEMKIKGGRLSDNQKDWISKLTAQGYMVKVCYGWQEASIEIHKYIEEVTGYETKL
jgi:hypothetical protein